MRCERDKWCSFSAYFSPIFCSICLFISRVILTIQAWVQMASENHSWFLKEPSFISFVFYFYIPLFICYFSSFLVVPSINLLLFIDYLLFYHFFYYLILRYWMFYSIPVKLIEWPLRMIKGYTVYIYKPDLTWPLANGSLKNLYCKWEAGVFTM